MEFFDTIQQFIKEHWFHIAALWFLYLIISKLHYIRVDLGLIANQISFSREETEKNGWRLSSIEGHLVKMRKKFNDAA